MSKLFSNIQTAIEVLLEELQSHIDIPDKNCSCHLSPPCGDCVDYSSIREAIANAKETLLELEMAELLYTMFPSTSNASLLRKISNE